MTKIAILGDTHFGARSSNRVVEYWQRKFFEECFWPEIKNQGITEIIQTGDYFDNRKSIDLQSLAFQKEVFVDKVAEYECNAHVIVGNHDIPYRNTLKNNSISQILTREKGFHVYSDTDDVEIGSRTITFMPWICRDNVEKLSQRIRDGGDIMVGHFEISGFVMHPGMMSKHEGLQMGDFGGWEKVLSGHYHTQSHNANIQYVGTPYQMNWNDANSKHGFWILDTTDDSMVFHENPFYFFNKFVWEGECKEPVNGPGVENGFVKVIVKKKGNFEEFENFIDSINFQQPYDLKIVESFEEFNQDNVHDMIKMTSTTETIEEYIESVGTDLNKETIKKMMVEIYEEALSLEEW